MGLNPTRVTSFTTKPAARRMSIWACMEGRGRDAWQGRGVIYAVWKGKGVMLGMGGEPFFTVPVVHCPCLGCLIINYGALSACAASQSASLLSLLIVGRSRASCRPVWCPAGIAGWNPPSTRKERKRALPSQKGAFSHTYYFLCFLHSTPYFLLPTSYFLLPTSHFLLPTPYFLLHTSHLRERLACRIAITLCEALLSTPRSWYARPASTSAFATQLVLNSVRLELIRKPAALSGSFTHEGALDERSHWNSSAPFNAVLTHSPSSLRQVWRDATACSVLSRVGMVKVLSTV